MVLGSFDLIASPAPLHMAIDRGEAGWARAPPPTFWTDILRLPTFCTPACSHSLGKSCSHFGALSYPWIPKFYLWSQERATCNWVFATPTQFTCSAISVNKEKTESDVMANKQLTTVIVGNTPNQPSTSFKFLWSKFGKKKGSFQAQWFQKWKWLHYNEAEDRAYWHTCVSSY